MILSVLAIVISSLSVIANLLTAYFSVKFIIRKQLYEEMRTGINNYTKSFNCDNKKDFETKYLTDKFGLTCYTNYNLSEKKKEYITELEELTLQLFDLIDKKEKLSEVRSKIRKHLKETPFKFSSFLT